VLTVQIAVSWDVRSCSQINIYRSFGGNLNHCFHHLSKTLVLYINLSWIWQVSSEKLVKFYQILCCNAWKKLSSHVPFQQSRECMVYSRYSPSSNFRTPFQAPGHRGKKIFTVASNVCGSSVWNLLRVTLLAPRILRWFLDFLEDLCISALIFLYYIIGLSGSPVPFWVLLRCLHSAFKVA
jgi:hypothetical protein